MPRVGITRAYRYVADRYYLDRANRDQYLYRKNSNEVALSEGLALGGDLDMDGNKISQAEDPSSAQDVDTKAARDAAIATHAALATVHQDAPSLIATHAADADAHHTKYTDAEAQAVADAQIVTHAADDDAHHTRYTDAEAVAAVGAVSDIGARVYHNAAQQLATGAYTALAFNSERYDTDTIHDTVTNNSRLTCKTAGKYLIAGTISFGASATGYRAIGIRLGGGTNIAFQEIPAGHASRNTALVIATVYDLDVNDYVELMAEQGSGGNLNVDAVGNISPEFMMQKIG